jgi:hypothetical protein
MESGGLTPPARHVPLAMSRSPCPARHVAKKNLEPPGLPSPGGSFSLLSSAPLCGSECRVRRLPRNYLFFFGATFLAAAFWGAAFWGAAFWGAAAFVGAAFFLATIHPPLNKVPARSFSMASSLPRADESHSPTTSTPPAQVRDVCPSQPSELEPEQTRVAYPSFFASVSCTQE